MRGSKFPAPTIVHTQGAASKTNRRQTTSIEITFGDVDHDETAEA